MLGLSDRIGGLGPSRMGIIRTRVGALPVITLPAFPNSVAQHTAWDSIRGTDPDAFDDVVYLGFLSREWPTIGQQDSYVFEVSFTDINHTIEIVLNPSYGSEAAARVDVDKYTPRLGKLPQIYRAHIRYMLSYQGDGTLTSEDVGHFFAVYSERIDTRIANNDAEESFFHEGTHASIQSVGSGFGFDLLDSPEFAAAIASDNAYVTEYAETDIQEDFAEHALFAWTILNYPERIPINYRIAIANGIPARIEFFRQVFWPRRLLEDGSARLLEDGSYRLKENP